MRYKDFLFFGGDKRQLFAAADLAKKGFTVRLLGFDLLKSEGRLIIENDLSAVDKADCVVFPVTGLKDGKIPVYFSDKEYKFDGALTSRLKDKPLFCGKAKSFSGSGLDLNDLLERGDFTLRNAYLTAEGALQIAMESYEASLVSAECLVIGFGRIGSCLSKLLKSVGASVTVASRSAEKRAYLRENGIKAVDTAKLESVSGFDIVFNTADAVVLGEAVLQSSDDLTLIIDLASGKGGVDKQSAERLGFTVIHALGLPGKCSPKTAGEIISDTILTILEEEYGWQKQA